MSAPTALICVADEAVRSAILFALAVEGIETHVCTAAQACADDHHDVNCIIIDQGPGTSDLHEVLAGFRDRGLRAPAIALISTASEAQRRKLVARGFRLVQKPLLQDELTAAIRSVVRRAGDPT